MEGKNDEPPLPGLYMGEGKGRGEGVLEGKPNDPPLSVGEGRGEGEIAGNTAESPLPVGEGKGEGYADIPGFCKSATLDEIRKHGHVLTPGRYVGAAPQEDDGEPFAEKMACLAAQWREQQAEAKRLDAEIEENLRRLGFEKER